MVRPLLTVALCGVVSALVAPAPAGPPEKYEFQPGLTATYDFEIEVYERDRIMVWKGSPTYAVQNVEGTAANLQYIGSFDGTSRPRDEAANAGPPRFGQRGSSRSSTSSNFQMTPRGEVTGAAAAQELPLPLGPMLAVPVVVLPETPGDRWETKTESELGLVSTFVQPPENGVGMRPPFAPPFIPPFAPFGAQRPGGFAFEERLHLTETVTYAAKPDSAEFERTHAIVSAETIGEKPRVEFASTGTVAFAEDGFLPARVEWSGAITLRTGSGEVTSPVKVSARRLSAQELDERAAAAESAQLAAEEKLRQELGQLVADLQSGDARKAQLAASRLSANAFAGGDAVVAAALHKAYRDADAAWRDTFGRALVRWATREQADLLIELTKDSEFVARGAFERLGELRVEKAIPTFVEGLRDAFSRRPAVDALKKLGPAAEPAVIEALGDRDRSVKRYAIEVLQSIGTGRSLDPLKKLAEEDAALKIRADAAVKAIEERVNAPVT